MTTRDERSPAPAQLAAGFRLRDHRVQPLRNRIVLPTGPVQVEPKAMDVLVSLARHAPEVATKDALIQDVWDGDAVGDDVVSNAVWQLRTALGDRAQSPRFIETIRGRGYRLIPEVTAASVDTPTSTIRPSAPPLPPVTVAPGSHGRWWAGIALLATVAVLVVGWIVLRPSVSRSDTAAEVNTLIALGRRLVDQPSERQRGRRYLERAIALDPGSALAHAAYADAVPIPTTGAQPEASALARQAVDRAMAIDDARWEVQLAWARVRGAFDWRWDDAAAALAQAQALAPEEPLVWEQRAWFWTLAGQCQEAVPAIDRVLAGHQDPPMATARAALKVLFLCRLYQRTADTAQRLVDAGEGRVRIVALLAASHLALDRPDAAREALARGETETSRRGDVAWAWAGVGEMDRARQILSRIDGSSTPYQEALARVAVGDQEGALRALDTALSQRDPEATRLAVDPRLDPLRSDQRFDALRARLGL